MKTLVVYDSMYGFTEKIAKAIGSGISGEVKVVRFTEIKLSDIESADLLIIGSPTQGGRMLKPLQEWLDKLQEAILKGKKVAVFDTRIPAAWVKIFSFAGPKIAGVLKKKGANLIGEPQGFFVKAAKGPFVDGEEARAREWGNKIAVG
jgi:flavodoxin